MSRSKARRNLPQTAMAAWRRLEAAKASQKAGPSSAEARGKEVAKMLGLSFEEYRRALAAQDEADKLSGRKPVAAPPTSTPLDGIYNLYVHKLYREGARIVNEVGDGNCMFRAIARQFPFRAAAAAAAVNSAPSTPRNNVGDEERYAEFRAILHRYYTNATLPEFQPTFNDLFERYGEALVIEYMEDWYRNRTLDKLSADQKKRVDEVLEKLKPFDVKEFSSMNASKKEEFTKLSKNLRDIYREGAPEIQIETAEQKREFLRLYAARVLEDGFWGGEAELYILSQALNIHIVVYPSDLTQRYIYWSPLDDELYRLPQILLLFSGRNHYKSILPPRGKTVPEWLDESSREGINLEDLREYGIAYARDEYDTDIPLLGGNFLSGKRDTSLAVQRLEKAYKRSEKHPEIWKHLARLAYLAAQRMPPSTVDPKPHELPESRPSSGASRSAGSFRPGSGSAARSGRGSAPGSRRGSTTRRTLEAAAAALAALPPRSAASSAGSSRPGSGASRSAGSSQPGSSRSWRRLATPPPLPPRRPQPPPSGFVLPVGALLPDGKRSLAHLPAAPPISNFAKNPLFNKSATRRNTAAAPAPKRAAAPPPLLRAAAPRSPPKGWWARFLGMTGTRRNRIVPAPGVQTIPGMAQQLAAQQALPPPPQVPPPPREPPTLQQRAAAAQWERARFAARIAAAAQLPETRAAAIQAQERHRRLGPPPGTRPPPHLPPLHGPNGQLIPRPPLYPKPKGGRRLTRRKIGKGRRHTRRS